jgi:hypothetical protein
MQAWCVHNRPKDTRTHTHTHTQSEAYIRSLVRAAKEQIRAIRAKLGDSVEIIAGNIASYDSAMYLLEDEQGARPDALKVA